MKKRKDVAERMDEILAEALEPGVFGDWYNSEDPALKNTNLHDLCKQYGYGAVMHYVEYLWKTHGPHPGSEHTVAACASVRRDWIKRASAILADRKRAKGGKR